MLFPAMKKLYLKKHEETIEALKKENMQLKRDIKVLTEDNLQLKNLKSDSKSDDTASNKENDDLKLSTHPEKVDILVFKCSVCYKILIVKSI